MTILDICICFVCGMIGGFVSMKIIEKIKDKE